MIVDSGSLFWATLYIKGAASVKIVP